jgi:hypothetical protein
VTPTSQKLPLWATVKQSYVLTFQNAGWFFRMAWLWLLVLVGVTVLESWFYYSHRTADPFDGNAWLWDILTSVPALVVSASVAVAWHCKILAGDARPGHFYFSLDQTVLRYAAWLVAFLVVFFAPIALSMFVVQYATPPNTEESLREGLAICVVLLWMLTAFCIQTRFSLVLPATALGHAGYTAGDAWRYSAGNFWRLFSGTFLTFLLPLSVFFSLEIYFVPESEAMSRIQYVASNCFSTLYVTLLEIPSLTFLSLAYRHFTGPSPEAPPTASAS